MSSMHSLFDERKRRKFQDSIRSGRPLELRARMPKAEGTWGITTLTIGKVHKVGDYSFVYMGLQPGSVEIMIARGESCIFMGKLPLGERRMFEFGYEGKRIGIKPRIADDQTARVSVSVDGMFNDAR